MTTADKLQLTLNTKSAIKTALINKGRSPSNVFSTYPAEIDALQGDGIITPAIILPANGATGVLPADFTLVATCFASIPAAEYKHLWAQWQVSRNSNFTNIVFDSGQDAVNLERITLPSSIYVAGAAYYARVRYNGIKRN